MTININMNMITIIIVRGSEPYTRADRRKWPLLVTLVAAADSVFLNVVRGHGRPRSLLWQWCAGKWGGGVDS